MGPGGAGRPGHTEKPPLPSAAGASSRLKAQGALGQAHRHPEHQDYRPLTRRRRLLVGVLGLATAITVMWSVLEKPGGQLLERAAAASATAAAAASDANPGMGSTACASGQGTGCVGGASQVLLLQPVPSSQPAGASSGR
jgi:hypothetical protein